ncbi:S ribonuclease [Pyrus ussuriensis x Pyrus communis]|uniref:S ribonuclease n=1 Tax=Pyrus ussuriensis x Pyrus communis TaxID=2448454 RepID=A0A5N5FL18_9ROSA|nr:S ribonuclease [Pyrus ussuriensis x Pyrus communis]
MSSSGHKSGEYLPPLYCQGGSFSKVGYFKATHVYKHAISFAVRVKLVKDDNSHEPCSEGATVRKKAIKFHPYYFVLGFTFPMPCLFQEVICSMKCALAQCSLNVVRAMVGFSNLSNLTLLLSCVFRLSLSVLLSPLRSEKSRLLSKEEIKWINDEALAHLIIVVEFAANEGGKKRSSSPACEPLAKKKPMTSFASLGGSSAAEKLAIDLTSPKGTKKSVKPEPVKHAAPKYLFGAKSGSTSERLVAIKSGKVDSAAKVAPRPVPHFAMTDLSAEKVRSASMCSYERFTESEAGKFPEVYTLLLKVDLLEDVDACAKFVDSVGKVVIYSNSFAKRPTYSRRSSLIAIMHKALILAPESMRIDQDAIKCAKEVEMVLMAQLRSVVEKIEELEFELAVLKGYDVSAPTYLQLEIAHQEVAHLKAKLSAIQVMLEVAENEVSCVSLVVEDLEHVNSKLQFAYFAKDDDLIFMHVEVSHLKEVASKLKSKEVDLQELDELQGTHIGLLEEHVRLKNEKASHEVAFASCQADFYKLSYVDHFQGRPSNYEFSEKDFEIFSISPVDLLDFSFEAGAVDDELMEVLAARNGAAAEGLAVKEPVLVYQFTRNLINIFPCFSSFFCFAMVFAKLYPRMVGWVGRLNEAADPTSSLRF